MTRIRFWFFFDVLGPLTYLNSVMTCLNIVQNDDSLDNMYSELRTANRKLIHQLSRQYPEICWSPGRSVSLWSHHCIRGPVGWAVERSPCWGRCRGCWGGPRQLCWSCCTCHMCHLHSSNGERVGSYSLSVGACSWVFFIELCGSGNRAFWVLGKTGLT